MLTIYSLIMFVESYAVILFDELPMEALKWLPLSQITEKVSNLHRMPINEIWTYLVWK